MSQATFLSADRQLTKTFYVGGKSDPYPLVKNFTSMVVNYEGAKELGEILETVGSSGYCLLKGELAKQIDNEPRVGLTNATAPTDLLVIDYDSDGGFTSIPELLETIDPVLADTDYIFQHSASSGITGKSGIRGHVFILLSHAVAPAVLKQWLKKVNLSEPKFKDRIKLSRNAMSLCYALDITVNQNDKLIYLAPPKLVGLDDPIEERYSFHEGENRTYTYNATISAESNRTKEHAVIADLQDRAGLTKRVPKYKMSGDTEMLTNPVSCTVSDPTDCGPYVRVNLNGGDSLAYWYSKENYEILYNFKGEPAVYLKDVAPEYYESLQRKAQAATLRPFVFREVETDKYYNAEFNEKTSRLEYCFQASRAALSDFMAQRGAPIRRDAVIPDWNIFFNPSVKLSVDFVAKRLNLFEPSIYIDSTVTDEFPIIKRVIQHICVNNETYVHFINWLAHITQFRTKTQTAWIFAGTEGCLSGDTLIGLTRGKRNGAADRLRTIKYIYEKWSGIAPRSFDRSITPTRVMSCKDELSIGLHEVYDIYESGVKPLWELTTNTGRSIKATKEHPFMRPDKTFTPLGELCIGDKVLVQGDRLKDRAGPGRNKNRVMVYSIPHHPHAWKHMINGKNYKRSHKARLVYEAALNMLTYEVFLDIIRTKPEIAATLLYLSEDQVIHHLDEDPSNDVLSNLACIDKLNHDQHHAKSTGLGTHPAIVELVTGIQYIGEEMTYDMTMKAPYHNYIANGFVVSNTGKGTLFHQILSPILGAKQTFMIGQDQAEDQFNSYMRTNLLLFLDEGDIETSKQADKMMAKFRTVITDPTIAVRQMRTTAINVDSYTNLIIATNKSMPVKLTDGDRRYNIAPRQNEKLVITTEEYNEIKNELHAFTGYLNSRQIQESDSYEILKSEAREDLMELSKTVADTYFRAIEEGDLDYFADALLETMPVNNPDYIAYAKVVQVWMASAGTEVRVSSTELLTTYQYLNNGGITDKKFGHLCKRHQLEPKRVRINGLLKRVYPITFVDRDYGAWLNRNNKLTLVPKITLQPNEIAQ